MKKIVGLVLFIGVIASFAFNSKDEVVEKGISFEHIRFEEAKAQAKEQGKYIFIDCYAAWCGPCKRMAATSFKDEKVGEVFNEKFINLKVDIEKDLDGPELARLYKIRAYPTLLIVDSNGKVVSTILGGQSSEGLIAFANSVK